MEISVCGSECTERLSIQSEHVKFEVYIGHSAGGLEDFQMYESRNLGVVRPIDKYLTI